MVDNSAVRDAQVKRLVEIRKSRDAVACEAALDALADAAKTGQGNLLELAVVAARARATVGEISDAMERAFGRHTAVVKTLSGVYGAAYADDADYQALQSEVSDFKSKNGIAPKMMVAKLGQDGHDRGGKVIASAFGDIGFEVEMGPLFQTPEEAADDAIAAGVHVVGMSSQAAGHTTLAPQLVHALKNKGAGHIIVVVGGVIPPDDYNYLRQCGVRAIFGPGTNIPEAAKEVLDLVRHAQ
jgi:methylmalonyl-CoA mutase